MDGSRYQARQAQGPPLPKKPSPYVMDDLLKEITTTIDSLQDPPEQNPNKQESNPHNTARPNTGRTGRHDSTTNSSIYSLYANGRDSAHQGQFNGVSHATSQPLQTDAHQQRQDSSSSIITTPTSAYQESHPESPYHQIPPQNDYRPRNGSYPNHSPQSSNPQQYSPPQSIHNYQHNTNSNLNNHMEQSPHQSQMQMPMAQQYIGNNIYSSPTQERPAMYPPQNYSSFHNPPANNSTLHNAPANSSTLHNAPTNSSTFHNPPANNSTFHDPFSGRAFPPIPPKSTTVPTKSSTPRPPIYTSLANSYRPNEPSNAVSPRSTTISAMSQAAASNPAAYNSPARTSPIATRQPIRARQESVPPPVQSRKTLHRAFEMTSQNASSAAKAMQYLDKTMLSNIALTFRDCVPLGTQTKGVIDYPDSFTGKDAVSTIVALTGCPRRVALHIGRSLESQLFIHEVDWERISTITDSVNCVYTFMSAATSNTEVSSPRSSVHEDDIPTGVFPGVGSCYSPACQLGTKAGQCYSPSCPHREGPLTLGGQATAPSLNRSNSGTAESIMSSSTVSSDRTWSGSVSKELLDKLPHLEIKRQEIIYETIYTEEDYINDLDLLETLFVKALRAGGIIPNSRLEAFIATVFQNIDDIRKFNEQMYEKLIIRQREQSPVITNIGDVFLDAARQFAEAYVSYNALFPFADARIKEEKARNPEFARFLDRCSQDPRTRRLDFRHFVQRPTQRLQRYTLFLEQIMKATEEDNSDRQMLADALEAIRALCRESDTRLHESEKKLKVQEINTKLVFKGGSSFVDMDLLAADRVLVHKGPVKRKSDTGLETLELFVLLFDNYLVMTKERRDKDGAVRYHVSKKPIPIDMLVLGSSSDGSQSKSTSSFHVPSMHLHARRPSGQGSLGLNSVGEEDATSTGFPFTVTHLGRNGGSYTLFADAQAGRKKWREKITETLEKRKLIQETRKVFEIYTITDTTFGSSPSNNGALAPGADPSTVARWKGRVLCSTAFRAPDGRNLVAVGSEDGVWIGVQGQAPSFARVLQLRMVSQVACMEEFGVFVVLADKVLWAYSLDALLPPGNPAQVIPQRLSSSKDVLFFNTGKIAGRPLLIYMRKKGVESHFAALEPVPGKAGVVGKNQGGSSFKFLNRGSNWFNEYKAFFIPSDSYGIQFLSAKVCIVCARGFEIMRLDKLIPGTIPDLRDVRFGNIARRCENSKPLGMYKLGEDEFLLCYDEFAFWVDRHGDLLRPNTIEWEGRPDAIALSLPYIIGFDREFIEIRHVQSGHLVQLISGAHVRCLNAEQMESGRIHATMQHPFSETQLVFELLPARR